MATRRQDGSFIDAGHGSKRRRNGFRVEGFEKVEPESNCSSLIAAFSSKRISYLTFLCFKIVIF